ncbi:MAG TPA: phosphate signaling complex protein PhoU [Dehalococcoidia bacterium]|nr:phosphate signaling complex protein PhoU [Dehalococcoidia bacterium]
MTRGRYVQSLQQLHDEVLFLGALVTRAIERSTQALRTRDLELSQQVIEEDADINRKRFEIEDMILQLIATQAPMALDLRTMIAALLIVTDLERMGDHAEGNARLNRMMADLDECPEPDERIWRMAELATTMLGKALRSFVNHDAETAKLVCDQDDEVDRLYDEHYRVIVERMVAGYPSLVTPLTYQLWTGHNLERIADRVTNICERVIFLVTGHMEEINVSRY